MAEVYLHVGPPMVGTVHIHNWLAKNEIALRALSIFALPQQQAHRLAVESITSLERRAKPDVTAILRTSLEPAQSTLKATIGSDISRVVVSSQYFSIADPGRVRSQLAALGADRVKIVFMLRRQDRYLESMYEHSVKALGATAPLTKPQYRKDMDWFELISPWARTFQTENIVLHDYDELVAQGKPVALALLDPMDAFSTRFAPTSPGAADKPISAALLEFQRIANCAGAQHILPLLGVASDAAGPPFRMAPSKAKELLALYRDSNRKVAREFRGREADLFEAGDLEQENAGADYTGSLPVETLAMLFALHLKAEKEVRKGAAEAAPVQYASFRRDA